MPSRRGVLRYGAGAALVAPFGGFVAPASAQAGPLYRFGVVADPQYAPVPPRRTRYYANSLWKMSEAIEAFNGQDLAFVTTLGDIIDRGWQSYDHVLPVYDRLRHPQFFILGNHDFEVGADYLASVLRVTGLKRAYYDFKGGGDRFLIIDGNDVSLFANPRDSAKHRLAAETLAGLQARKAPNAQVWNGGPSDEQFAWIKSTMDEAERAGERIFVLGHYPVFPENEHNMWGSERFVDLVTGYRNFVAYFNGHNHAGNYGTVRGKHFVNLRGMVETPDRTAYSVVEVHPDRVEIKGFGLQEDRTLAVSA